MGNPPGNPNDDRSGNGRFTPSMKTAERRAAAARLRIDGYTTAQIADMLGFTDAKAVSEALRAVRDAVIREPGEELIRIELERLDAQLIRLNGLETKARKVLEARHITVNNGRVILHPDTGEPMEDDAPVLQAIDRLVKIEDARNRNAERRAKLTGIEAAVKVDATVHEVSQQDLELQEMLRDAKARVAAQEEALRDSSGGEA
jgi:predicted transcriptional regulator